MNVNQSIPDWGRNLEAGILDLYLGLPTNTRGVLDPCPKRGHQAEVWRAARTLRRHIKDKAIVLEILLERWGGYHKCVRPAIERAVSNAFYQNMEETGRRWPKMNNGTIRSALSKKPFGTEALIATSEVKEPGRILPHEIIGTLWGRSPLICMGKSPKEAFTNTLDEICVIQPVPCFVVPNPMSQKSGKPKEGQDSPRCLDNTGPRKYLVVEFDSHDFDTQATLHHHLGIYLPRVLTLSSGNKSLHGWYLCRNQMEDMTYQFMRYAVSLGADPATFTACQLVRTPNAMRDTNHKQEVLTFNPSLRQ